MESEGLPSTSSFSQNDKMNLEHLLQIFGSGVSFEDIASAYSQSGRNLYDACNVLCSLQGSTSKSLEDFESASMSSVCSSENSLEMMTKATMSKPRKPSASLGTVSDVIGKGYVKPQVSNGGYFKPKPVKLNSHDFPESELWDDKDSYSPANGDTMHQGVEEFLFEMLGEGFSLDKSVIRDIVGQCGYDVTKSMDKLLYLSASKLEKSDDILEPMNAKSKARVTQHEPSMSSTFGSLKHDLETGSSSEQLEDDGKKKHDLEKEVLNSLFCLTVRPEEEPRLKPTSIVRRSPYGKIVEKPVIDTMIEYRSVIRKKEVTENDKDKSYEDIRKAVKEYWSIMREYYRAASEAFANEDLEKAKKLIDEGHFYMVKAQEADEESAEKLLERNDEEDLFLDLLDFEPKEAVRFLKVQLNSFCGGIGTMKHLKARVKSDEENGKVGPVKRLVTKFLQREDIKWTEEGDGSILAISLDQIDRNKLSFANK